MKVCVWFGMLGSQPNHQFDQTLFCEGEVLQGLGPRQCGADMVEATFATVEDITGLYMGDVTTAYGLKPEAKVWVHDNTDKDTGEGFTAVFVDLEDLK